MSTISPTPAGPTAIYYGDQPTWGLTLVVILLVVLLGFVMVLLAYTVWRCRKQGALFCFCFVFLKFLEPGFVWLKLIFFFCLIFIYILLLIVYLYFFIYRSDEILDFATTAVSES